MSRTRTSFMIFCFIAFSPSLALAGLADGPVAGPHGFPAHYRDANGLTLEPCLDTAGGCGAADGVPTTFPSPVHYWIAEARMPTYGGKGGNPDATRPGGQATATLTMELLGTFPINLDGDRPPVAGGQLVIQSLQVRIDSLLDQQLYTVTTPYGVFSDIPAQVDFDGAGQRTRNVDSLKETFQRPDEPVLPGNFDQSMFPTSPYSSLPWTFAGMDRFLTCAGGPQPTGFLGPVVVIVGVPTLVECTVEGSPLGPAFDIFRVEGPEVGGGPNLWAELSGTPFATGVVPWVPGTPPVDMIETTQFRITGHVVAECSDGVDNDGDGLADFPEDPGCADAADLSELSPLLPCDDGADNDGDGWSDFQVNPLLGDPGCRDPQWPWEDPKCQDGVDNDGQTGTDFDGGVSVLGSADPNGPDPQCVGRAWANREARRRRCGLGFEIALPLAAIIALRRRRQGRT